MSKYIVSALSLIKNEFDSVEINTVLNDFLAQTNYCPRWMLYSDYCLDDRSKPNDVITYVLVPYLGEEQYKEMDDTIHNTQSSDIKKVRSVNTEFMEYLKSKGWFSFSFILDERKNLLGNSHTERVDNVRQILDEIKQGVLRWKKNAKDKEPIDYYDEVIKKLDVELSSLSPKSNIKEMMDILLITLLGAYCSAMILKRLPQLEIFGWFPDRDSINEACNQIAFPMFHVLQYNHMGGTQYQFVTTVPDNTVKPFYDNYNRIADYICGTLADYDLQQNVVSKDKFSEVLKGLVADNEHIKIYRLSVVDGQTHLGGIKVSAQPFE